jgi:hypothetical protein
MNSYSEGDRRHAEEKRALAATYRVQAATSTVNDVKREWIKGAELLEKEAQQHEDAANKRESQQR